MINDAFPHIGEAILERIINENPNLVLETLGLAQNRFVRAHRQIQIEFPKSGVIFDGFSTIDLGLQLTDGILFPIEVKLGHRGLNRATVNQKLASCTLSSHTSEPRISGNILAVLNRHFDSKLSDLISLDALHARVNNQQFIVSDAWGVIARNHVLTSWAKNPPDFNGQQRALSLEEICSAYGPARFNCLVRNMLSDIDYYEQWIK